MSQGVGGARCGSSTELHPAGQSRLAAAGASTTVRASGTWMPSRTPDRGRHVGMRGGGQSREQLSVSMSQLVVHAHWVVSWGVPVMLDIGGGSCRERVCQYVLISGVESSLKKKLNQ